MTKAQRQDLHDCQNANCKYLHRCKVHWGRRMTDRQRHWALYFQSGGMIS